MNGSENKSRENGNKCVRGPMPRRPFEQSTMESDQPKSPS